MKLRWTPEQIEFSENEKADAAIDNIDDGKTQQVYDLISEVKSNVRENLTTNGKLNKIASQKKWRQIQ